MDSSYRTIQNHLKSIKLKRFHGDFKQSKPQSDILFQKIPCATIFPSQQTCQLKNYSDNHLFRSDYESLKLSAETLRKRTSHRRKTQNQNSSQTNYLKKNIKRLNSLSYKTQRSQRSQKVKKAIEDLKNIDQFQVNCFQNQQENFIRFNKENYNNSNKDQFIRWRTLEKQRSNRVKSPSKFKREVGKRAKISPNKISPNKIFFNLRIRKTQNSILKQKIAHQDTAQSLSLPTCHTKKAPRKASIAPWDSPQEFQIY